MSSPNNKCVKRALLLLFGVSFLGAIAGAFGGFIGTEFVRNHVWLLGVSFPIFLVLVIILLIVYFRLFDK